MTPEEPESLSELSAGTDSASELIPRVQPDDGMTLREGSRDRLVALAVVAALAFNYPFLFLFSQHGLLFGIPLFYFYLFVAWALLIVLAALVMERSAQREGPRPGRGFPFDA